MKAGGRTSAKTAKSALHTLVNGDNTHSEGVPKCHNVEASKGKSGSAVGILQHNHSARDGTLSLSHPAARPIFIV
jgi:hypothetical protein